MIKKPFPKFKPVTQAKLSKARKKRDENQTSFWNRIGITQSGGSRYESGRFIPVSTQILIDLAYGDSPLETLAALRGVEPSALIQS